MEVEAGLPVAVVDVHSSLQVGDVLQGHHIVREIDRKSDNRTV